MCPTPSPPVPLYVHNIQKSAVLFYTEVYFHTRSQFSPSHFFHSSSSRPGVTVHGRCRPNCPVSCRRRDQPSGALTTSPPLPLPPSAVVKVQNVVAMAVDGMTTTPAFGPAGSSSADTSSPLYLGGVPNHNVSGVITHEQYVGCIRKFKIINRRSHVDRPNLAIEDAKVFGAVTASTCPVN